MLYEFLISLPLLLSAIFGLLFISDLGFLRANLEQASFFSARSEFVGLRGTYAGRFVADMDNQVEVRVEEQNGTRSARVYLPYRSNLPFVPKTTQGISGLTTIPERGEP